MIEIQNSIEIQGDWTGVFPEIGAVADIGGMRCELEDFRVNFSGHEPSQLISQWRVVGVPMPPTDPVQRVRDRINPPWDTDSKSDRVAQVADLYQSGVVHINCRCHVSLADLDRRPS